MIGVRIMLDQYFNMDKSVNGTDYYINRSIMVGGVVITTMQKLGRELSATNILEVFKSDKLLKETQDEFTKQFPDSEEARFIKEFEDHELDNHLKCCFEVIKPLIPRLELKTN